MKRLRLISWDAAEVEGRGRRLRAAGYEVSSGTPATGMRLLQELRETPPDAVVIDLDRRPSYGREVAVALRQRKATRGIVVVFAGGAEENLASVRAELPDAVYGTWDEIEERIARALASPPADPVVPPSHMERYAGRPLPKKLGWKEGSVLALAGAPPGFREVLGPPPEGARVTEDAGEPCDLLLWFTRSQADLEAGIPALAARTDLGRLWIAWPKKASGVPAAVHALIISSRFISAMVPSLLLPV